MNTSPLDNGLLGTVAIALAPSQGSCEDPTDDLTTNETLYDIRFGRIVARVALLLPEPASSARIASEQLETGIGQNG